jgi:nicotinamide-nucleotide amidase
VGRPQREGRPRAAIVLVGTELVTGLQSDTNGEEVARALMAAGVRPSVREVLPDDLEVVAERLAELTAAFELVIVTGGLGPTHDDVTRDAAARALGRPLERDAAIAAHLKPVVERHRHPAAAEQVMRQADVLRGARVLQPTTGTAPGQLVPTSGGHLLLLPGPPHELRPMLTTALDLLTAGEGVPPRILGCVDIPESDGQLAAESALAEHPGVGLTVLARPSLITIVLFDEGAGPARLDRAAEDVVSALGDACYADDDSTLAETVIRSAAGRRLTIALAESCTGGMIATELTTVSGASAVFVGSAVTYADSAKVRVLGVAEETLRAHGAVSSQTASEMAHGVRNLTGADIALAVTGIAGPAGGDARKPVGTVWFALDAAEGTSVTHRLFTGNREVVRSRATAVALNLLRHEIDSRAVGDP